MVLHNIYQLFALMLRSGPCGVFLNIYWLAFETKVMRKLEIQAFDVIQKQSISFFENQPLQAV